MLPMNRSGDGNAYNRFVNLDNIEYRIVNYLAKSTTKYANNLWKILKYDTEDCLSLPEWRCCIKTMGIQRNSEYF